MPAWNNRDKKQPLKVRMDLKIEILHDVAVSPNLAAHARDVTTFCPTVCVLSDGSIVCTYRHGKEKHSRDGKLLSQRSTDGGATWHDPVVVFDGMSRPNPLSVHTGAVCVLDRTSLLAVFTAVDAQDPQAYIFSEAGRTLEQRFYVTRSFDGGLRWSDAEAQIIPGVPYNFYIGSQPFLTRDGAIFLPIEATLPGAVEIILGTVSTNQGASWEPVWNCLADPEQKIGYGDPRYCLLPDGGIVMLAWTWRIADEQPMPVHRCFSTNHGRTWTRPVSTNVASQIMNPLALDEESLIAVSNVRTRPEGIRLWHSSDAGNSWNTQPLQMWDPYVERILGTPLTQTTVETDAVRESLWDSLPSFTFGTPELLHLGQREFLLMYYGTVTGVTHVRACRFRVL